MMLNNFFTFLLSIYISSSVKCLYLLFVFQLGCLYFYYWTLKVLYTCYIRVFSQICGLQIFLPACSLSFHPLNRVFYWPKPCWWGSIYRLFLLWIVILVSSLKTLHLVLTPKGYLTALAPFVEKVTLPH